MWSLLAQKGVARRRAAVDFFLKTEMDEKLLIAYDKYRSGIDVLRNVTDLDAFCKTDDYHHVQDHTTSPSASAPFVKGASASTASHRTFVTIASRPSCRVRRADSNLFFLVGLDSFLLICPSGQLVAGEQRIRPCKLRDATTAALAAASIASAFARWRDALEALSAPCRMGGAKRYPSIASTDSDGFREELYPSCELSKSFCVSRTFQSLFLRGLTPAPARAGPSAPAGTSTRSGRRQVP